LLQGRWRINSVVVLSIIVFDVGVVVPCVGHMIDEIDEISKKGVGREIMVDKEILN
jgi:hypothetical protein